MTDIVIVAILAVIVGFAGFYVYHSKKSGKKCIGCPCADSCSAKNGKSCCNSNK